jgi:hypothetical protein
MYHILSSLYMNRKIQIQYYVFVLSFFIILVGYSCNDDPLTSENNAILEQIAGCQNNKLNKSVSGDSCFFYTFETELNLQFCVSGNCCPDSNRYTLSSKILRDTIEIAIKDTARNLCKCICQYFIHACFQDLNSDRYIIKCVQGESIDKKVLYLKEVNRD